MYKLGDKTGRKICLVGEKSRGKMEREVKKFFGEGLGFRLGVWAVPYVYAP